MVYSKPIFPELSNSLNDMSPTPFPRYMNISEIACYICAQHEKRKNRKQNERTNKKENIYGMTIMEMTLKMMIADDDVKIMMMMIMTMMMVMTSYDK